MILIPKRKTTVETPDGEALQSIIAHTSTIVYDELGTGYSPLIGGGRFDDYLKIPVGTDKYK